MKRSVRELRARKRGRECMHKEGGGSEWQEMTKCEKLAPPQPEGTMIREDDAAGRTANLVCLKEAKKRRRRGCVHVYSRLTVLQRGRRWH